MQNLSLMSDIDEMVDLITDHNESWGIVSGKVPMSFDDVWNVLRPSDPSSAESSLRYRLTQTIAYGTPLGNLTRHEYIQVLNILIEKIEHLVILLKK